MNEKENSFTRQRECCGIDFLKQINKEKKNVFQHEFIFVEI